MKISTLAQAVCSFRPLGAGGSTIGEVLKAANLWPQDVVTEILIAAAEVAPVPQLWCMHILGPDDVHAAPSKEHAEKAAAAHNALFKEQAARLGIKCEAVAALWPHSAASHAESVVDFIPNCMLPAWQNDAMAANADLTLAERAGVVTSMTDVAAQAGITLPTELVQSMLFTAIVANAVKSPVSAAAIYRNAAHVLSCWEGDPGKTGYMGDFNDAEQILELLAAHAPTDALSLQVERHTSFSDGALLALQVLNSAGDFGSASYNEILRSCGRQSLIDRAAAAGSLEITGLSKLVAAQAEEA